MQRQAIAVAVAGAAIAAGVFTVHVVRSAPEFSYSGATTVRIAALLLTGWALVAAGLAFAGRRPRVARLLVASGLAWFLLEWKSPTVGSPLAFTLGLCLYAACPAVVGHAVLAYPSGRLASRLERVAVGAAYVGAALVLGLLPALAFDPRTEGCSQCATNLVAVADRANAVDQLRRVGVHLGAAWALALAVLALARLLAATWAGRRPGRAVYAAGAAYLGLVTATFVASFHRGFYWEGGVERDLWIAEAAALLFLVAGIGWDRLRIRRARSTVAQLVIDLSSSPPPGGLRDLLAGMVGDPDLQLAYQLGRAGRLVDSEGRVVEIPTERSRTTLVSDGRPVAVLAHAPGLLQDPQLVEEVTAAARLALENERLNAERAARIEELRASRVRIVAAGDAERKRIERDLHDGAQQRLVALSLSLRLLRQQLSPASHPAAVKELDDADAELDRAVSELRELAHGIFPAVLADGGFAAAVRALAEDGSVQLRAAGLPQGRFPPTVEAAAYSVVAEAARSTAGPLVVRAEPRGGALVVEVEAADVRNGLDRVALEDRLGALDGRLSLEHAGDGRVTIRAELPCVS